MGLAAKFDEAVREGGRDEDATSRVGMNREHYTGKPAAGRGKIPLLFLCSAEKFPCSADLIPLLRSAAELTRKQLI